MCFRLHIRFTGADPDRSLNRENKDLPVANLPGPGRFADGCDHCINIFLFYHDLELDLGQHVDSHLASAVFQEDAFLFAPSRTSVMVILMKPLSSSAFLTNSNRS